MSPPVQLDTLISFQSATVLRLIQSVGLGLLFVPVTMAGYIGMPAEKANSVAGIINFMRNIGSSVGTSMVTTLLARRAQVHQIRKRRRRDRRKTRRPAGLELWDQLLTDEIARHMECPAGTSSSMRSEGTRCTIASSKPSCAAASKEA
jgi:hypothetical protein